MNARILPVLLALLLPSVVAAGEPAGAVPSPVPALQWPDVHGKVHQLKEWRGRAVLVNYWATWCGPCLKEMPELQAFSRAQPAGGVQVLGVALDEAASIEAYLKRVPVAYPILIETAEAGEPGSSGQFGNRHGVLPYSVLIDGHGRVVKTKAGSLTREELRTWTSLLAK